MVEDHGWTNAHGEYTKYIVVDKNTNSKDLGFPTGTVTLMTSNIEDFGSFDAAEASNTNSARKASGNNNYLLSNMHQWLNSDAENNWYTKKHVYDEPSIISTVTANPYNRLPGFMHYMTSGFKGRLKTVALKTTQDAVDGGGQTVTDSKLFLLSRANISNSPSVDRNEGPTFDYYDIASPLSRRLAKPTLGAIKNNLYPAIASRPIFGNNAMWVLRSISGVANGTYSVSATTGEISTSMNASSGASTGIRYGCCIDENTPVSMSLNSNGAYEIRLSKPVPESDKRRTTEHLVIPLNWAEYMTSVGRNQPFHPDIVRFNGVYVLVYTPFPASGSPVYRDRWECPCIAISDDLKNWREPAGLQNPLDDLSPEVLAQSGYMSDPCLVVDQRTNTVWCYYRVTVERTNLRTFMLRKSTTDLSNWSEAETLFEITDGYDNGMGGMIRSQTILYDYDVGKFKMWFGQGGAGSTPIVYLESSNGVTWTNRTVCKLIGGPTNTTWHPDVKHHNGTYYLTNYDTATVAVDRLSLYTSTDGINFTFVKDLVRFEPDTFYSSRLYKSTLVTPLVAGGKWSCIFTAEGKQGTLTIASFGIMEGDTPTTMQVVNGGYFPGY